MGLFDIFSGDAAKKAAADKEAALRSGYADLTANYDKGRAAISGGADEAQSYWDTISGVGNNAYGAYADALGLNGQAGNDATSLRFTNSPGYKATVQAAIDAVDRSGSARGMLTSGNTVDAIVNRAGDVANKDYSNWLASYAPLLSGGTTSAAAKSAIATGEGAGLGASFTGQGNAAYGLGQGVGDAQAQGDLADYQASGNLWNAILGAGQLAASVYGYGTGGKVAGKK